jgi:PPM family protein phosphatase
MKFAIAQETRIGARRMNQDRIAHWASAESLLMVVADGLGGHLHGEIAAEVAVDSLGAQFAREAQPMLADPQRFLAAAVVGAHAAIQHEAGKRKLREAPRTVVVACVVQDGYAYWTHIGDCRLYHLRQGHVLVRTRDHTRVQQLVDEGRMREEAVSSHPERNRLLQCLGGFDAPRLEPSAKTRLAKDDVLLLCSDGFWGPLTQRQLANALVNRPLGEAIRELVGLAETRAGRECDNVSVMALAWGEEEVASAIAPPRAVPAHDVPTDVQDFTATDLEFLRMSDEDIEKAIAEIKAALRKYTPR